MRVLRTRQRREKKRNRKAKLNKALLKIKENLIDDQKNLYLVKKESEISALNIGCPRPISAGFVWLSLGPDLPVDIARGQSQILFIFINIRKNREKMTLFNYYKKRIWRVINFISHKFKALQEDNGCYPPYSAFSIYDQQKQVKSLRNISIPAFVTSLGGIRGFSNSSAVDLALDLQ
ncbi:hypothetical protein X798_00638 [Onchocerca flexuosa]|uniref:Uncharacterized protein n=1 Tax=Onchocerca flexuosa TaxID=387005 RepID=A0A238C3U6_9BILA|nr:hypothetical protein X798_00638 [Onchocerca flexuosa]